ncbi:MAG: hypothetical protein ACT4PJ_16935 [Gemmatimonadaceae bacterium]
MLFTVELARRLGGTGVTVNCVHAGVIGTNLLDDYSGRSRALSFLTRRGLPGPEVGARTPIHVAGR